MGIYDNVDLLINKLDEQRIQRKIQFLLDIRGYLIVNELKGDYVEFGLYRGEMLYGAFKIMKDKNDFNRYIGLDTFEGEPEPQKNDDQLYLFVGEGGFNSDFKEVSSFLSSTIGNDCHLIKGDFRNSDIQNSYKKLGPSISVGVIDCNWISSQTSALDLCLPNMIEGSVLYHDDLYISNFAGPIMIDLLNSKLDKYNLKAEPFKTYPPFAKAFFIFKK